MNALANPTKTAPAGDSKVLAVGAVLVATAIGIALFVLSKKASATTTTGAIELDPSNAGTAVNAKIGGTITVSLPVAAGSGYSWKAIDQGDTILTGPTTQMSATGESDTWTVTAAGTTLLSYQLTDATGAASTAAGSQLSFTITAS